VVVKGMQENTTPLPFEIAKLLACIVSSKSKVALLRELRIATGKGCPRHRQNTDLLEII
jgi:hypothetical protein